MVKYAVLGVVQGLTEFLPVSSSGHLVIAQKALGISGEDLVLQLVLHLGTLCAVLVFLRGEIRSLLGDRRLMLLVLLTTLVTGAIGVLGRDFFAGLFSRFDLIAPQLAFTGVVLLLTGLVKAGSREKLGYRDAVIVGLAQALAIVPAISRSAMTIASLLFRKVDRKLCFTFSFLVFIPAVIGASLFEIRDMDAALRAGFPGLALGFAFSLASGMCALWLLRKLIVGRQFHYFGYYCLLLAFLVAFVFK